MLCGKNLWGEATLIRGYDDQRYSVELLSEDNESVAAVLAREDRAEIARTLYELMLAQYLDRVIVLREGKRMLVRSDRAS